MEAPRASVPLLSGRGCGSLQGGGRRRASPAAPTGSQAAHLAASHSQPARFIFFYLFKGERSFQSNRRCFVVVVLSMFSLRWNLSDTHFLSVAVAPPTRPFKRNHHHERHHPTDSGLGEETSIWCCQLTSLCLCAPVRARALQRGGRVFWPKESDLAADR